jgi:DNA-binding response OmpR family regulator
MKVRTTIRRSEGQERILVVDDEPSMVTRFKELLDKQGYEVESALFADEGLIASRGNGLA